jgi:hypothetical protein
MGVAERRVASGVRGPSYTRSSPVCGEADVLRAWSFALIECG